MKLINLCHEIQPYQEGAQSGKLSDNFQKYLELKSEGEIVGVLIILVPANLTGVESANVANALKAHAKETQGPILDFLKGKDAEVINTFWLLNSISANVTVSTVRELIKFQTVGRVYGEFELPIFRILTPQFFRE